MSEPLLRVEHLTTAFHTDRGVLRAVDDVSFSLKKGSTLAVVGESGCGKSVTALSIMRLIPSPPGRIESGSIGFLGKDLTAIPEPEMRKVRGDKISMIFQEPMTSLNPVYSVGAQIIEAIRIHRDVSRRAARERAVKMLELVGIPSPAERIDAYPHQLSGGMRQRVMIAMALSCEPELLIADEPTTALDVTIQAQILDLLRRLQEELGMSILFITHDLGVVAEFASDVVVMYAGRVVETAGVRQIFADPLHPYTQGLLASVPPMDSSRVDGKPRRLTTIDGVVPDLAHLPTGCRFADRCALFASGRDGVERCTRQEPELRQLADGRAVRCHFAGGEN
ncbi:MAG: ABC transporter ATP-binding protein [Polyangiaceae bacterium]|nr:ABC transporter ATP-binding protein [Polyangiaceae bacterium]